MNQEQIDKAVESGETLVCRICGEETGSTGSLRGHCHKLGPVGHEFDPVIREDARKVTRISDATAI